MRRELIEQKLLGNDQVSWYFTKNSKTWAYFALIVCLTYDQYAHHDQCQLTN